MILYFHIFALSIQIKILYRIFHTNIFEKRNKKSRDYAATVSSTASLALIYIYNVYTYTQMYILFN